MFQLSRAPDTSWGGSGEYLHSTVSCLLMDPAEALQILDNLRESPEILFNLNEKVKTYA